MRKLILFIMMILVLSIVIIKYEKEYYVIPNESIRVRIIPNSNNVKDQYIKNQVKDNLEKELEKDLKDAKTIENSRTIIKNNINKYDDLIKDVLKKEKSSQKIIIDYGNHYFPEKKYKGKTYSEGEYESLLVTLGKGEGDNWWCVLFPPICKIEEKNESNKSNKKNRIEYSFYIKEMLDKYLK